MGAKSMIAVIWPLQTALTSAGRKCRWWTMGTGIMDYTQACANHSQRNKEARLIASEN